MANLTSEIKSGAKIFSLFSLTMLTVGSVDSIRNLPAIALFGASLIFFFILATVFFLLPSVLVFSELAAAWPEHGGVYVWVKRAFGKKMGFLTIWLQLVGNIIWYPTILSFAAATLGYLISPSFAENKFFLIGVVLTIFWATTIINLKGLKLSSFLSSFCALVGLLLPMLVVIFLGGIWIFNGNPLQVDFHWHTLLPEIEDPKMWIALTGIIMAFSGIEVASIHAPDVKNPARTFPRALIISMFVLIFTLGLGSLAVAVVLPEQKISLVSGVMQTFSAFFTAYHLTWVMPVIAASLIIGIIGGVSNWIIVPTKGIAIAAEDGHLPKHFAKRNKNQMPHFVLLYQAIVVSLLMLVFLLFPSVNASYWLLTTLAVQIYMLMYILLFASALFLRFKHPNVLRPFKIPGRFWGMVIVCLAGMIGTLVTFVVGFIPPGLMPIGGIFRYEFVVLIGLVAMILPPFFMRGFKVEKAIAECVIEERK
jgi:glutamate:GABA antiporter